MLPPAAEQSNHYSNVARSLPLHDMNLLLHIIHSRKPQTLLRLHADLSLHTGVCQTPPIYCHAPKSPVSIPQEGQ